jgi:hypothetical protein
LFLQAKVQGNGERTASGARKWDGFEKIAGDGEE